MLLPAGLIVLAILRVASEVRSTFPLISHASFFAFLYVVGTPGSARIVLYLDGLAHCARHVRRRLPAFGSGRVDAGAS